MHLKEFSMISQVIESAEVFKAIQTVISTDAIAQRADAIMRIEQTLSQTKSVEERKRKLPSQLVICLVIAMSLWSTDSMTTVLRNLVNGLSRQWTRLGQYWKVPGSSSITECRQRVGCRVMSH